MRRGWLGFVVAMVLFAPAIAYPCGEKAGACDWFNPHVTFSLTESKEGLTLSSVVQGCPGKRAAHQDRLEAEIARAAKGETCEGCPFGVKGLSFAVERTELGMLVRISGPQDQLAEFRKRFEAKMAARKDGPAHQGCPCSKAARKSQASGPGSVQTCGD